MTAARRPKPSVDPRIARVKLPMLFAWLAEGKATPAPGIVFEAAPVSDTFPPIKHIRRTLPRRHDTALTELQTPPAIAVEQEAAVAEAQPAEAPEADPPSPEIALEAPEAPPFLPPPLIAPVLAPRPILSRVDDFLPSRAPLRPNLRPRR